MIIRLDETRFKLKKKFQTGLDWSHIQTQFLESKKLWTEFGFGKVQSTYTLT